MPGFPILEKLSADPAAGAEIIFTAAENMIVRSCSFLLVTDATVANRRVTLVADDGVDIFFQAIAAADQAASLTHRYSGFGGSAAAAAGLVQTIQLPAGGLYLPSGGRLRTLTTSIQAGDNFGLMTLEVERI